MHEELCLVELDLRQAIRELLRLYGKPVDGGLRALLYAYDLVTPEGRVYFPDKSKGDPNVR